MSDDKRQYFAGIRPKGKLREISKVYLFRPLAYLRTSTNPNFDYYGEASLTDKHRRYVRVIDSAINIDYNFLRGVVTPRPFPPFCGKSMPPAFYLYPSCA